MVRFYVKAHNISQNKYVNFDELQSKKLRKVLRMKVGDLVEVFDGTGNVYDTEMIKIANKSSLGVIKEAYFEEKSSNITLVQSLPKNLKIEFILQKTTELNVDKIIFFESEYSQIDIHGISEEKVKRWKRIVAEASEQCRRNIVPEIILYKESTEKLIEELKEQIVTDAQQGSLCYLDIDGNSVASTGKDINYKYSFVFVGPEGGFSPDEKQCFKSNDFVKVKLSSNVLRSETAGMAYLSQIEGLNI